MADLPAAFISQARSGVNALTHRDYVSTASVQVMLLASRAAGRRDWKHPSFARAAGSLFSSCTGLTPETSFSARCGCGTMSTSEKPTSNQPWIRDLSR